MQDPPPHTAAAAVADVAAPGSERAALCRRVEEASLNAWPAMHQVLFDGWMLRFSQGFTKRANSITPIYPALVPVEEKIRYCENLYARQHLQTIFRLTSIAPDAALDDALTRRGYSAGDRSLVLLRDLDPGDPVPDVQFVSLDEWLPVYAAIARLPEAAQAVHRVLLRAIRSDTGFALVTDAHGPVACGLGVADANLLGLFDIATHPDRRRGGAATRIVQALMGWGRGLGATHAYLQMVADNEPAARLYRGLGFHRLYDYWYRKSD